MIWQNKSVSVSFLPATAPGWTIFTSYKPKQGISPGQQTVLTQGLQMRLVIKYQSKSVEHKVARRDLFAD